MTTSARGDTPLRRRRVYLLGVRAEGVEPSCPEGHQDLNLARLPFRHAREVDCERSERVRHYLRRLPLPLRRMPLRCFLSNSARMSGAAELTMSSAESRSAATSSPSGSCSGGASDLARLP